MKKIRLLLIPILLVSTILGIIFKIKSPILTVVSVTDGDTIKLSDGRIVRYIGIDTPELKNNECFAEKAKEINQNLVLGRRVKIVTDLNEMDQYGRILAYVFVDDIFVNEYLLSQGAGKFYFDNLNTKYSSLLAETANESHKNINGLWETCAPDPKSGCVIKGNLDKLDHRYYHLPSFRHYSATQVNLLSGDQWFCTEKEAKTAGFERARE